MPRLVPLRAALLGLALTACTAMGGSEDLGGGDDPGFTLVNSASTPADGAPTVPLTATVSLVFSSPIDPSSVTSSTLSVEPATFGTVTVDGSTLTFDPSSDLLPSTTYVFSISPDLKGLNGHALGTVANPYGFKTIGGDVPPPPPPNGPRPR
ncbi:MAG TPA: Ig-like domain-containing protein [Gemmatimonadales bacterium]|nr:Ig-like domain-containing protein [Gemmatimonadales bacterium]